ncbi:MAG: hypothetical protein Q4F96_02875 [Bacillota bacterium]|nr:hypothetical protein [Bacillota bacterium]
MLIKLNRVLRVLIAIAGGVFLLMALIARIETEEDDNDGFPTREFDDIW